MPHGTGVIITFLCKSQAEILEAMETDGKVFVFCHFLNNHEQIHERQEDCLLRQAVYVGTYLVLPLTLVTLFLLLMKLVFSSVRQEGVNLPPCPR